MSQTKRKLHLLVSVGYLSSMSCPLALAVHLQFSRISCPLFFKVSVNLLLPILTIYSETLEQHLSHLETVLERLRQHGLKLELKKCSFLQLETQYLGFVINGRGISPDPKKVEAIRSLPTPTCVREVLSFIGMCSYYRRFIPNFSEIAEPVIDLTRKFARFKWTEESQNSFDYLKQSLTVIPLLAYPDPNKPYTLYTDASNSCIGACLIQQSDDQEPFLPNVKSEKPIYYLSHKLSKTVQVVYHRKRGLPSTLVSKDLIIIYTTRNLSSKPITSL